MKFILFTTHLAGSRPDEFQRFYESVYGAGSDQVDVEATVLLQQCTPELFDWYSKKFPKIRIEQTAGRLSLSVARNIMIDKLFSRSDVDLGSRSIVAFPDDDCWYPPNALSQIETVFRSNPSLQFFFSQYHSEPFVPTTINLKRPWAQAILSEASSITIFMDIKLLKLVGPFDESLGVGTPLNGGEDTEFAIRLYLNSVESKFTEARLIGHRSKDRDLAIHYFPGSLYAIHRHAYSSMGMMRAYLRKLLVGAYYVFSGRMQPAKFLSLLLGRY